MIEEQKTVFASAARSSRKKIQTQVQSFQLKVITSTTLKNILDAINSMILVLNNNRQTIYANKFLSDQLGFSSPDELYGQRPGEIMGCIHATDSPSGCGTTKFCRTCGAISAILSAQLGQPDSRECHIIRSPDTNDMDFGVSASPLAVDNETYVLFTLLDISNEIRRKLLERIFFHDVMNTAGIIWNISEFLNVAPAEKIPELSEKIYYTSKRLIDEITSQQILSLAENFEFSISPEQIDSIKLLEDVSTSSSYYSFARNKNIELVPDTKNITFESDRRLLERVLSNMVKNALEASTTGETIRIGCKKTDGRVQFWVHNNSFMPEDVQTNLFKRSVSTKGKNRGLGTYSIKLLSERYLRGKIAFTSTKEEGTTFYVTYPLDLTNA